MGGKAHLMPPLLLLPFSQLIESDFVTLSMVGRRLKEDYNNEIKYCHHGQTGPINRSALE